ncbi:MAG: polyphosphate kinase 1 [Saprospiraceae bacterium]|nr:polyphosphate kinase 1 [Saprospiraceae bacterium]
MKQHRRASSKLPDNRFIHRDISWLSFNERVLQEADNSNNPLLERIKFMAIYSNNLDEFFRVRVANQRNLLRVGKKTKAKLEYDPKLLMRQIRSIVNAQQERYTRLFSDELIPALKRHHIHFLRQTELNQDQEEFIDQYFNNHMLPFVQPVLLVKKKIRPFLSNAALYLIVVLHDLDKHEESRAYAIIKVPSDHLPRFIQLPDQGEHKFLIMIDDVVRRSIPSLFPGYTVVDCYSIKLTRDAELYIDDEFSGDLIDKIRKSLTKRNIGPASRLVYDREMDADTLLFLREMFELETIDLFPEGRYHNNMDFFRFPDFGMTHLQVPSLPPLRFDVLEGDLDFFQQIRFKDRLINPPYHSFESVIRFFEGAATDPAVTHIKLVQYRVGSQSRIMNALKLAVANGKEVAVFIEVKARFDEAANLSWGEELERHGVKVNYSFPGLKVHAKLALVQRLEDNKPHFYTYLSTGNFHEGTVRIYSDIGLFTADERISTEVARIFTFLETVQLPERSFEHLLVGQFNLVEELTQLIENEMDNARRGLPASICLKLNSIQDPDFIDLLYKASMAGVKIRIIARGICCLIPGDNLYSANIEVISIVDRFLEHSRIHIFHNNGDPVVFLSSADWMTRNLHYRIETAFPIYNPDLCQKVIDIFEIQWNDNVKARVIDKNQSNHFRPETGDKPLRSQYETYFFLKRRLELSAIKK